MPELYRLALDRYNQEGTDLLNKYGLLSDQYDKEYSRYREDVSDWQAQRDYLANLFNSERNFDYTGFRDQVADDQWQKNFDEALRQYNESLAEQKRQFNAQMAYKSSGGGSGGSGGGGSSSAKASSSYGPGISTKINGAGLKASPWNYSKHNLEMLLRSGNFEGASKYMDTIITEVNEGQYKELMKLWDQYNKS